MRPRFPTRTLFDLYPDLDMFTIDVEELGNLEIQSLTGPQVQELYMAIAAKYGDSNLRYTNEYLFKLNLFKEINDKWPRIIAWQRDQKKLRDTDDETFKLGGKMVQNSGAHNTANVSTDTIDGINQLDAQSIAISQRGDLGVLQDRLAAYKAGEEDRFIKSLAYLFVVIIAPMSDLLYGTKPEEDE